MDLNMKSALGVLHISSGFLSITASLLLFFYGIYPQELTALYFQLTCGALGLLNILLGLESIFLSSNDKRILRNELTFGIISSVLLGILLIATSRDFAAVYLGNTIMGSEADLWEDIVILVYNISYFLGVFIAFVLICVLCISSFLLYKNLRER